jgi:hypothetical protein
VPSTVAQAFGGAGLEPAGAVRWGDPIPAPAGSASGIYMVSLAEDTDSLDDALPQCPVSRPALGALLAACPGLTVDGGPTTAAALATRLSAFWLPDEVVLYIGLAGQPLWTRVRQYYKTPLGAKRPHKGGWWLKTLSALPTLWVHYAPTTGFAGAEQKALAAFAERVSDSGRAHLHDTDRIMPFANLEHPPGTRKAHGIAGATAGDASLQQKATPAPSKPAAQTPRSPAPGLHPAATPTAGRTQRVTAKDIEAGRIRIPQDGTKRLFPREKQSIDVGLRGTALIARWDPKYGPDRERSGVLAVGRDQLRGVVKPDEVLRVTRAGARISLR